MHAFRTQRKRMTQIIVGRSYQCVGWLFQDFDVGIVDENCGLFRPSRKLIPYDLKVLHTMAVKRDREECDMMVIKNFQSRRWKE